MILGFFLLLASHAASPTWQSGPQRVHVLELFSSEGCSSCPGAESWLAHLQKDPRVFQEFIPIGFHVDYWDHLGWKDPLAQKAYSERQRRYSKLWGSWRVYTPGFVLNGKEWKQGALQKLPQHKVGILKVRQTKDQHFVLEYTPQSRGGGIYLGRVALLGLGLKRKIKKGENQGRTLTHGFVSLGDQTIQLKRSENKSTLSFKAEFDLKITPAVAAPEYRIVFWIETVDDPTPIQATGGLLHKGNRS